MPEITEALPIIIRLVWPDELSFLRTFSEHTFRAAWQDTNAAHDIDAYCADTFSTAQTQVEYEAPDSEFYFAVHHSAIVAYTKLNFAITPAALGTARTVQIERLYVHPDWQNHGIGTVLLNFADKRAKETNSHWLWLTVWQKADRSRYFYERHGFEIFGESHFQLGTDAQTDWMMKRAV